MKFTVFGSSGFIGSALTQRLREQEFDVATPSRNELDSFSGSLGHVIYAVGMTADFRQRPFDTFDANTAALAKVLRSAEFESLLYLSSTRIYRHGLETSERARISVQPADPEDLYDLTKLLGESLCNASGRREVRVARLSNVVGSDFSSRNFLPQMIRSAVDRGAIDLRSALDSAKDYILLDDVVAQLPKIAMYGREACYNVASGANVSHRALLEPILKESGASLTAHVQAPLDTPVAIDISRMRAEFGFIPSAVVPEIGRLVRQYRESRDA